MVFAFVLQCGKTWFWGLRLFGFGKSSLLAIVQIIVRIVRDCTEKIAVERVSAGLVNYLFAGTRFLIPINGFCHCAINVENRVLGFEAVCFGLKQLFSNCSAIDRD